jgi:hypothetical protein
MKECSKCGRVWPLSEYHLRNSKDRTYRNECRECRRAYHSSYYLQNRDRYREHQRRNQPKRRKQNRQRLLEYLSDKSCVDCGEADPVVLELDHVHGRKQYNVGSMVSEYSWDRIAEELEKCEVRRANCHRRKTARDFKWFKGNFGA